MTGVFLETARQIGFSPTLIDRRFSHSVAEVGKYSLRKIVAGISLWGRTLLHTFGRSSSTSVFFCTTRPASFLVDWVVSEILRLGPRRRINYIHTTGFQELARRSTLWRFLVRRLLSSAHACVCLGPSLTSDVDTLVSPENVYTVPNTPTEVQHPTPSGSGTRRKLLFLSNLIEGKGLDEFIELAQAIRSQQLDVIFFVAGGEGYPGQIEQLRSNADLDDLQGVLNFLGPTYGADKWQLLKDCDLLIFPSTLDHEAQPLTILEAMSVGTPTVAFDTGGVKDLIVDDVTGRLLPRGDTTGLRHATIDLVQSPTTIETMSRAAANRYCTEFSRDKYRQRWSQLLQADKSYSRDTHGKRKNHI